MRGRGSCGRCPVGVLVGELCEAAGAMCCVARCFVWAACDGYTGWRHLFLCILGLWWVAVQLSHGFLLGAVVGSGGCVVYQDGLGDEHGHRAVAAQGAILEKACVVLCGCLCRFERVLAGWLVTLVCPKCACTARAARAR